MAKVRARRPTAAGLNSDRVNQMLGDRSRVAWPRRRGQWRKRRSRPQLPAHDNRYLVRFSLSTKIVSKRP